MLIFLLATTQGMNTVHDITQGTSNKCCYNFTDSDTLTHMLPQGRLWVTPVLIFSCYPPSQDHPDLQYFMIVPYKFDGGS